MIGALFNLINIVNRHVSTIGNFTVSSNVSIFGDSSTNIVVNAPTTTSDLLTTYNSLDFKDLTVNSSVLFDSGVSVNSYANVTDKVTDSLTRIYPHIIRCSNKLTITNNGYISANGQGAFRGYTSRAYLPLQPYKTGCETSDLLKSESFALGYSAQHDLFDRLYSYGSNRGFLEQNTFLSGTCGGYYYYHAGGFWGGSDSGDYNSFGFSSGGAPRSCPSYESGGRKRTAGASGGFIVLYFKHLIIDGKEYGKDPGCNISCIQANGVYPKWGYEGHSRGGGMLLIAADTIEIQTRTPGIDSGSIMANGTASSDDSIIVDNINQWRWSVLNNYPQLCFGQTGWIFTPKGGLMTDANGKNYYSGATQTYGGYDSTLAQANPYYFYNDGVGNYYMQSIETSYRGVAENAHYSSSNWAGGAGIALGYKIL